MTLDDLKGYAVKERAPLCVGYRGYEICGVGPPSSGGPTVAQTLKLVEPFDLGKGADAALGAARAASDRRGREARLRRPQQLHRRSGFRRRAGGLLDDAYIAQRRALIDPLRAADKPKAGEPPGLKRQSFGVDATIERAGTSHISIIDDDGNAVAMTTTIEGGFGSHNWAAGLPAQQRADGLLLRARRRGRPARRQRRGARQAPAQLDGADHRVRREAATS